MGLLKMLHLRVYFRNSKKHLQITPQFLRAMDISQITFNKYIHVTNHILTALACHKSYFNSACIHRSYFTSNTHLYYF